MMHHDLINHTNSGVVIEQVTRKSNTDHKIESRVRYV